MTDETLLPCPFCGSEADTYQGTIEPQLGHFVWDAYCTNATCPCELANFATKAEAITAWNTRHSPAHNALADEMSMDRRNAEIERAYNKLAEQPCTTQGAEDLEAGCCAPCRARTALAALRASPPRISTADVVEHRAREICERFGADPDEVTDPYGPVLRWHGPAYHINEAIEALRSPPPGETVPDPREQWEREHNEKIAAWLLGQVDENRASLSEWLRTTAKAILAGDYLNTPAQEQG